MNRSQNKCSVIAMVAFFFAIQTIIPAEKNNRPALHVEKETVDFGKVIVGAKVPVRFHIQNRGKGTLLLYDVTASCTDCTTILSSPDKLEANEKGVIEARVLTAELHGNVDRTVSIYSNDPGKARKILHIIGHVWSPLEMEPNYIYFPVAKTVDSRKEYRVEITNITDEDIHLSKASSDNEKFRAKLIPGNNKKKHTLVVTTVPPLEYGRNKGLITFNTSYAGLPTIQISAIANVSPPVAFVPSRLYLKAGDLKKPIRRHFKLSINSKESVKILEHSLNIAGPTIEVTERKPGKYVQFAIFFPEGFRVEPDLNASLTVKTTHRQFSQLNLPIQAYSTTSGRNKD
ncbi:MAG: DUF1573 domain-containing protein [Verrucomicrobia bacterium]|nr:DUF1573 domain-containing protein [Verrucomicrobiota bacterium]